MRILLTNDDGIGASGIQALWQSLSEIGEVTVVAPVSERSATSQAITVHHPIRVDEYCINHPRVCGWRVDGTPTDCVKIAVEALLDEPPDIIVSGVNHGPNLGTDVLYSGTVSAAIEGALYGFPAIAVSLNSWQSRNFSVAARFTVRLVQTVLEKQSLPPRTLLNVNVPDLPETDIRGVKVAKLGVVQYANIFQRRFDPRGRMYYWMGGEPIDSDNGEDSDVAAVKAGYISVTPVHFDLTHYSIMKEIENWRL
ncbi:MAG: 5'/3'-nucleotidase SurE [Negativicutes bacterium]|nr:5'/3'-nucleotidase SurE [Negativicutes bacterium]